MSAHLMESILSLLAVSLIPSITGSAVYFTGRFIERKAQLLVFIISVLGFSVLSSFTLAFILLGVLSPLSPLAFLLCVTFGGFIHRKSGVASPDLFRAFLFMFLVSGVNFLIAAWIPGNAIEKYYMVKMGIVPNWLSSIFLFFILVAPTIATSYLLIFRISNFVPALTNIRTLEENIH